MAVIPHNMPPLAVLTAVRHGNGHRQRRAKAYTSHLRKTAFCSSVCRLSPCVMPPFTTRFAASCKTADPKRPTIRLAAER